MNLLQIVQRACALLNLPVPTAAYSSNDLTIKQMVALSNEEGDNLVGEHEWQALQTEETFTTVAAELQTHTIPTDLHHIIKGTIWARTQTQPLRGSLSVQRWQAYKGRGFSSVFPAYRIRGGVIRMTPAPTAGQTIAYEYQSNKWCSTSDGATTAAAWGSDTYIPRLPDRLFVLGLKWRWLQAKGFDYSAAYDEYAAKLNEYKGADVPSEPISLNGSGYGSRDALAGPSISDGSWNQ